MRILFDIVHPADVLFFQHPIQALIARGDEVKIAAREKDVTTTLLADFDLPFTTLSQAGRGLFGLGRELIVRDWRLWRMARDWQPDVMLAFGGVSISHVGRISGIPALSFYDTEIASLQTRLTWPFITHLYVPQGYAGAVPEKRVTRAPWYKELSYFHPQRFKPDIARAKAAGYDPQRANIFMRLVSWGANHDLGKAGWTMDFLRQLIRKLGTEAKIHISSEMPLPDDLAPFAYQGRRGDIHHLMGFCQLYLGESATMAAEAVMLAVPALYIADDWRSYMDEMEQAGCLAQFKSCDLPAILAQCRSYLAQDQEVWRQGRDDFIAGLQDPVRLVLDAIDLHGRKA